MKTSLITFSPNGRWAKECYNMKVSPSSSSPPCTEHAITSAAWYQAGTLTYFPTSSHSTVSSCVHKNKDDSCIKILPPKDTGEKRATLDQFILELVEKQKILKNERETLTCVGKKGLKKGEQPSVFYKGRLNGI